MKVSYMTHMGSDALVVDAARVSFDKRAGETITEQDIRLINYLARHDHWSPFAHPHVTLRCEAPVYVARQLAKHQVGFNWNEVSRRYVDYDPNMEPPSTLRARPQGSIKQGSGDTHPDSDSLRPMMADDTRFMLERYNYYISKGVAPEQARAVLPLASTTAWVWTGSLIGWIRLYKQRSHPTAQAEAAQFAEMVQAIIKPLFPASWNAWIGQEP